MSLAGADVCHVDASKGSVSWCKENMQLSKVPDGKVRLIIEDCMKYIQREERRNKKYDGIRIIFEALIFVAQPDNAIIVTKIKI